MHPLHYYNYQTLNDDEVLLAPTKQRRKRESSLFFCEILIFQIFMQV